MVTFLVVGTCASCKAVRELIGPWHNGGLFRRRVYCLHRAVVSAYLVQLSAWVLLDQGLGTLVGCRVTRRSVPVLILAVQEIVDPW